MAGKEVQTKESSSYLKHKADAADLSLLEKLDTIPALLSVLINTITAIFTRPLRSGPDSYFKYVGLTAMRTLTTRTTPRQQHYLTPPTDESYVAACKKRGFTPNSEILEDGTTRAHWIGSSKAEKLILNFHGGGYVMPAGPEMFEFMFQIVDSLKSQGKSIAVLFLSYDLAPGAIYPRQLQQAALFLNHVLNTLSISPSNILLTGDSAGANLALSLLSHISHPHTNSAIQHVKLSSPLRGALLISPWVSFSTSTASFQKNAYKDVIDPRAVQAWSNAFLGETPPYSTTDNYNEAILAPASWWKDLQAEEVLITAGAEEVLLDGIVQFAAKFKEGATGSNVEFLVLGGMHDQPNIDLGLGYKESDEGVQAKKIKSWVSTKL